MIMTYYVYRTNCDEYAIGAFTANGTVVSAGQIATFKRPEVAVTFARGMAETADDVVILPSV